MKTRERLIARALRREQGLSVRDIAVAVGVSRSTASLWLRDVPLTDAHRAALVARNPAVNALMNGSRANPERARTRRRRWQADGRERARVRDPSYLAGCALFWAEGSKSRNQVHFSLLGSGDGSPVRPFLRDHFAVRDDQLRVSCNLFADHEARQHAIEDFWLAVVGVPRSRLRKTTLNVYSRYSQQKRTNMLAYGTCRVSVASTEIVQTIFGSIQEMGRFDRPEWLD